MFGLFIDNPHNCDIHFVDETCTKEIHVPYRNKSPLTAVLEEMSQTDDTSAVSKLGNLLMDIPTMSVNETAALWHLLGICALSPTTPQSKQIIESLRSSLWARMCQILYQESSSEKWSHCDISQIEEIVLSHSKKKTWWQRLTQAA